MNDFIYLDNAATTWMDEKVKEAMEPYFMERYSNPSSVYSFSRENKSAMKRTRDVAAKLLGAKPKDIYFTSGGSEAINWAIKGVVYGNPDKGRHIVSTKVEHHATLHTLEFLEKMGFEVTYLDVDDEGFIDLKVLEQAIRKDTVLVSIMAANNEIGTILPLKEIGRICREKGTFFHTDAVQAIGSVHIDVEEMNIDFLSASAHKFHGPKGVGFLYLRSGIVIENLIHGGNQERGRRSGTENVAGIVGLGKALETVLDEMNHKNDTLSSLRDRFIKGLLEIEGSRLNGPAGKERLPNNINISFTGVDGEALLLNLDLAGILASSGSACTSGAIDESHVLKAIGVEKSFIRGSLRLTLSKYNTEEEVDKTIETIREILRRQRKLDRP
ncbi:cysteine desulfurase NifS [Proteiniclasticum sp.]|uniref:cysteine desulfurase NifS n=1 Tax=Proteiniclasticum sp. TaxID=2053595 RepID=UPI0028A08215|nr:cysteine desulfurase NifS [Proteiniclasticum sp.]